MAVKITGLVAENVKRIRAVALKPESNGLTVIGGDNGNGKTSVLDAIAWALGGERFRPSQATRDGSVTDARVRVELSNGLIAERGGKNGELKVLDPSGKRAGQMLLDTLIEKLALDMPAFMRMNNKAKAETLLKIIGVGDKLKALDDEENKLYNERLSIGRIADRKQKHADEMTVYPEAPTELLSAKELILRQQEILARNGERARKRLKLGAMVNDLNNTAERVKHLREQLEIAETKLKKLTEDIDEAKSDESIQADESTAELERDIEQIEDINSQVRANFEHEAAAQEAADFRGQYDRLTESIDDVRENRRKLLDGARLPLEGLSVDGGEITYLGRKWDCMSGSEQLRVSAAIVRALNPQCGFVLLDGLEQMDAKTLKEFGEWLENEGLQGIATRVSTGDECSIIIEDGYALTANEDGVTAWKAGEF